MKVKRIRISKRELENLPVFFSYIISNKQLKGKPFYHFNDSLKVYQDYICPLTPISKL